MALNNAYCSDKYQYTMGKSFYDSGMKDQTAIFNIRNTKGFKSCFCWS